MGKSYDIRDFKVVVGVDGADCVVGFESNTSVFVFPKITAFFAI